MPHDILYVQCKRQHASASTYICTDSPVFRADHNGCVHFAVHGLEEVPPHTHTPEMVTPIFAHVPLLTATRTTIQALATTSS